MCLYLFRFQQLLIIVFFSLLKVHLQVRNFTVFIDVEKLEAGKFDNNLLQSIKQASNFVLVLTPNALDRCVGDLECKDWIHRVSLSTYIIFHQLSIDTFNVKSVIVFMSFII